MHPPLPTRWSPLACRRPAGGLAVLLLLAPLGLAAASGARAAGTRTPTTRTVTTLDDTVNGDAFVSLREAILASAGGDVINFAVTGTITLGGSSLATGRNLTLVGPGARKLVVSGNDRSRVFEVGGGAVVAMSGLTISRGYSVQSAGEAPVQGGGLFIQDDCRVSLNACTLSGNRVSHEAGGSAEGGGVYVGVRATLDAWNCTFTGNGAKASYYPAEGGAISSAGHVGMSNCTLVGNSVAPGLGSLGAGAGLFTGANATLVNCTFTANQVSEGAGTGTHHEGGGVYADAGSMVELRATLIAGNTAAANLDGSPACQDLYGAGFISRGHNFIGQRDGSPNPWLATDQTGTAAARLDPRLELAGNGLPFLKANGGPTDTVALLADSAALDHGDDAVLTAPLNLTTDQRAYARRAGAHVDVGAYERDLPQTGPTLVVTTLEDSEDLIAGKTHCSLREALNAANSDTDLDTITFRPGLSGTLTLDPAFGRLEISYPVTVVGPGARVLTVSGGRAVPIFSNTAAPVSISGLTVADGLESTLANTGMLTLQACAIRGNTTKSDPAFAPAVVTSYPSTGSSRLDIRNCTFSGNLGGALLNVGSTLVATNCTFSGNSSGQGAGLYSEGGNGIFPSAATTLLNCTLAGNTATGTSSGGGGGGIYRGLGSNTLNLRNTLVAGNSAVSGGPDVSGAVTSDGNNLIGKTDGSSGWIASDKTGIADPKLDLLRNNGGPTDTRALLAGSPALNAAYQAAAPPKDQRDFNRPDTADIGAFEYGGYLLQPPVDVSVLPSSGTSPPGTARRFTAKYTDPNGAGDFAFAYLLVNTSTAAGGALYGQYDAVNNKLYLRNNANTAWLGGFAPGTANTIGDPAGKGTLNCAATTVARSGTTLTVTWSLTPNASFAGNKNLYLSCQDKTTRRDGLDLLGTWSVAAPPVNVSVTPNTGTTRVGAPRLLTTVYTDLNGAADVSEARLLINGTLTVAGGLFGSYDAVSNKLYLRSNSTGAWIGGFAPGSANVISDPGGKGSLNCGGTAVARSGNTLTVRWSFTPGASFTGTKNLYLYVKDRTNLADALEPLGTWTVTP